MRHQSSLALTAMALAITGVAAMQPAIAQDSDGFSMTGTYEGVFACDDITDGVSSGFFAPTTVKITQEGTDINLMLTYSEDDAGEQTNLYRGSVRADPGGDAISGFFEGCGGSYASRELARIFPVSTADDDFSFSADSIFQSTAVPQLEGQLVVESCKYVLERVSTEPPEIETCD